MSDNLRSFVTGTGILRNVANRVPDGAWDNRSCCDGWTARDVAGHIIWGLQTVANFAEGGGMADEMPESERAGSDPATTIIEAVDAAIAALDQPGAIHQGTPESWGGMSLDQFLSLMAVDSMTHAWDIADATGIDAGIDEPTAAAAHQAIAPMADRMRGPGRFDEAVHTDSPHALDQLIAFLGRTSVRT